MLIAVAAALVIFSWDRIRPRLRRKPRGGVDEAQFLAAMAADLRAGQSIRAALANAAGAESDESLRLAGKLAVAGAPLSDIAPLVKPLHVNGSRVAAALQLAEVTGGRSAAVFGGLADRAVDEANRRRERRALTAQSRFSAAIVVGLPVVGVLVGGAGRVATLLAAGTGGALVAVVGVGMQAAGAAAVWRMATR